MYDGTHDGWVLDEQRRDAARKWWLSEHEGEEIDRLPYDLSVALEEIIVETVLKPADCINFNDVGHSLDAWREKVVDHAEKMAREVEP